MCCARLQNKANKLALPAGMVAKWSKFPLEREAVVVRGVLCRCVS